MQHVCVAARDGAAEQQVRRRLQKLRRSLHSMPCARLDYNLGGRRLSSYTCQFHPELTESLRDARAEPPDGDGDQDDGRRLLASMLRADADGRASTSPCGYHHYGL